MIRVLLLRFDAPLMAFGGPVVDHFGVVRLFPAASMLTGLCANALGWSHGDTDRLTRLQQRVRFAARLDRPGATLMDFQTATIGKDDRGWTTRGIPEGREGGPDTYRSPHVRFRHYRADSVCTVALTLEPPDEAPTLDALVAALDAPSRPLFLGRKTCLPAAPLVSGRVDAPSLLDALRAAPLSRNAEVVDGRMPAQWPATEEALPESRLVPVTDERDWLNQIHGGERLVREGLIEIPARAGRP
jgi:CRISPR system Cascade subunit CasD